MCMRNNFPEDVEHKFLIYTPGITLYFDIMRWFTPSTAMSIKLSEQKSSGIIGVAESFKYLASESELHSKWGHMGIQKLEHDHSRTDL